MQSVNIPPQAVLQGKLEIEKITKAEGKGRKSSKKLVWRFVKD